MDETYNYHECESCYYYRIDKESGDGYCKRTYSQTTPESSCDCFMSEYEF